MLAQGELSLFHKILVLVEDRSRIRLDELDQFGNRRQTLGALGRLEGLNYLDRVKEEDGDYFVLTERGDTNLADMLDTLTDLSEPWDEKWRIIIFDIPESQRTVRQMFRLKLLDLGARMLQSSVWITPNPKVVPKFSSLIRENGFTDAVHFFEATHLGLNQIDITKLWQLNSIESDYRELFRRFQHESRRLTRDSQASYKAKCMIVQLALVVKKDPQLSDKFMPKQWVGNQAVEWYEKLRVYCN